MELTLTPDHPAAAFVASIDRAEVSSYGRLWAELTPRTPEERYLRWVYALLSVHTRWRENVRGFEAVLKLAAPYDPALLAQALREARVGLYQTRVPALLELQQDFPRRPWWCGPLPGETTAQARVRLSAEVKGLGLAKTAFALELLSPLTARTVCLDAHMLRLYGLSPSGVGERCYRQAEDHWVATCLAHDVPPAVARFIFFDREQRERDSLYWAGCLRRPTSS